MAGRGQQTFNKRQKEQQRKERQQEKMANRLQRKKDGGLSAQVGPEDGVFEDDGSLDRMRPLDDDFPSPSSSPNNPS